MIEKLLENWLDSASKRSYQPVFVQILSGMGYRVVHSTRHCALEFGKDILAVAPDGTGCAYQLKGNPGGTLGLNQFRREVQPQLVQLVSQPVIYPGFPSTPHKAFLVSNGFFEEEVQRAVDDMNRGSYRSRVELVSRGDLLSWSKELGLSVWPSDLTDTLALLELYLANPRDLFPVGMLASLLDKILVLEPEQSSPERRDFDRRVTSAALLTGIASSRFSEVQNHFALAIAWSFLAVSIIASCEKNVIPLDGAVKETLRHAEAAVGDALIDLWQEVEKNPHLSEGDTFVDFEVRGWRYSTVIGALACLALYDDGLQILTETDRDSLRGWLTRRQERILLWGEGVVSRILPWLVWLCKHDATMGTDGHIASLAREVVTRNQPKSDSALPSPYHPFDGVLRATRGLERRDGTARHGGETFAGRSFTAEILFHLLVRTNLKQRCKSLWPDFSRLFHREAIPAHPWQYCRLHFDDGVDQTKQYPHRFTWEQLRADAINSDGLLVPHELRARPWLLGLWWQMAPYRCTTPASHALVDAVLPNWR